VKAAEARLQQEEETKAYIGPAGEERYNEQVLRLVLGAALSQALVERAVCVQTPGGCGALRVGAELLRRGAEAPTVHVPDPTWANHMPLLGDAGLEIQEYPYFDRRTSGLRFDAMSAYLEKLGPRDVVLLHGCCHNPCGADLDRTQWQVILELAQDRGFLPFVDLAYQGFGEGLDEDAYGVRLLAESLPELLVATSCSKNFGLYRERAGAILLLSGSVGDAATTRSQVLNVIRGIYSMPPAHGGAVVDTILADALLRADWEAELAEMRDRINGLRARLVARFAQGGDSGRFGFIAQQRGMFSFLGISPEQVSALRSEHGIYMVDSSRINVAGVNDGNIDALCAAVLSTL
jgi:aspartate aminotransferase